MPKYNTRINKEGCISQNKIQKKKTFTVKLLFNVFLLCFNTEKKKIRGIILRFKEYLKKFITLYKNSLILYFLNINIFLFTPLSPFFSLLFVTLNELHCCLCK